ncbi:MAG: hypothetical protein P1V35_11270 [Planctomycetota bacterium]|nr:hypothetical protein [Planctomycetota bacterium]
MGMKAPILALLTLALSVSCQSAKSCGADSPRACPAQDASSTAQAQCPAQATAEAPPMDANGNGIDDLEDISNGTSMDANANGIPDEVEKE